MSDMESTATGGKEDVLHSFPLSPMAADNLLQLDELQITLLTTGNSPKTLNSPPKSSPGHHRATLLLDGLSCSSTSSSPAGSFDVTSAQATPTAAGGSVQATTASVSEGTDPSGACLSTAGVLQAHAVAGSSSPESPHHAGQLQHTAPSSCLADDSNVKISTNSTIGSQDQERTAGSPHHQQQQQGLQLQHTYPGPSTAVAPATSTSGASSTGSCPATLQLPDFAAFLLPEECAFAESSIDDALMTPTPHTPVVQSIFTGDGLPVSGESPLGTLPRGCHSR